jgi:hypothetical protein
MAPISITIVVGLLMLVLVSGAVQQKILDKWTHQTGRVPMINRGRGSWYRYLRSVKAEMPQYVRRRIAVWNWVGHISIALAIIIFVVDAAIRHR